MGQASAQVQASSAGAVPRLRRVLTLWDLIFYGIVVIMPIAPVPLFGIAQKDSHGHAVTAILIAMVAMMLTAFSYGRMATVYPMAGSAYTYVGRGLSAHLGFLAGWAMFLDYLLIPLICTIYGAETVQRAVEPFFPQIPSRALFVMLAVLFAGTMTYLNLRGIRSTANTNLLLLFIMCAVIGTFMLLAIRYLFHFQGWGGVFSLQPFYDRKTFSYPSIAHGTALAALTYIGFDGVTTLAEDVENPKRNVLLATVLVCLITGILGGSEVYLAQRVWPDWQTFPHLDTAYMDVARRVGGELLFHAMVAILILANLGSGLSGQVGAARLLFGMGRDNVLPRKVFAYLDPRRHNPTYNLWIIGVLVLSGALVLSYEQTAEVLNFGAFLAFMGVNLAALRQFYFLGQPWRRRHWLSDAVVPGLGFLFCLWIWWNLSTIAKTIGGAWFGVGIIYDAIKSRGFRTAPVMIDFSES
jgi:putrescine importer